MSPQKQIKDREIAGQIEDSFSSKQTVNQGDSDKPAVGIDSTQPFDLIIFIFFFSGQKT